MTLTRPRQGGLVWPDDYLIPGIEPYHQEEGVLNFG